MPYWEAFVEWRLLSSVAPLENHWGGKGHERCVDSPEYFGYGAQWGRKDDIEPARLLVFTEMSIWSNIRIPVAGSHFDSQRKQRHSKQQQLLLLLQNHLNRDLPEQHQS